MTIKGFGACALIRSMASGMAGAGLIVLVGCSSGDEEPAALTRGETLSSGSAESRRAEVDAWVLADHARLGHRIVLTETTEAGTVIDWVDRDSTDAAGVRQPPSIDPGPIPDGVKIAEFEPVAGPPGTVPYVRPQFGPYVLGQSDARTVDEYFRALPHGNPNALSSRLYAELRQTVTNYGVASAINGRWSGVDLPSGSDFVITESASFCTDASNNVTDLVGVAVGRLPPIYGSNFTFEAEYAAGGTSNWHWITGGGNYGAYTQYSSTQAPGMSLNGDSIQGGTQYESPVAWILFPNQWWLYYNGNPIGYISGSTFSQLSSGACKAYHYGEALDVDQATTSWMAADMGSGLLPTGSSFSSNFGYRGSIRIPSYYAAVNAGSVTRLSVAADASDGNCYGAVKTTDGSPAATWNPTLFYGGPGGGGSCL